MATAVLASLIGINIFAVVCALRKSGDTNYIGAFRFHCGMASVRIAFFALLLLWIVLEMELGAALIILVSAQAAIAMLDVILLATCIAKLYPCFPSIAAAALNVCITALMIADLAVNPVNNM